VEVKGVLEDKPAGEEMVQGKNAIVGRGDPKDPMISIDTFVQDDKTMRGKHEVLGTNTDGSIKLETKPGPIAGFYDAPQGMFIDSKVGSSQTGPGGVETDPKGVYLADHGYPVVQSNSLYLAPPQRLDGSFDPEGAWRVVTTSTTGWNNPAGDALKTYLTDYDFSSIPAGPRGQHTYDLLSKAIKSGIDAGVVDANLRTQLEQQRSASEIALAARPSAVTVAERTGGPEEGTEMARLTKLVAQSKMEDGQRAELVQKLASMTPEALDRAIKRMPAQEQTDIRERLGRAKSGVTLGIYLSDAVIHALVSVL
jgi:hypothetical protein